MQEPCMVPERNRARAYLIDIQLPLHELLRNHGKLRAKNPRTGGIEDVLPLDPHDAVLRQEDLPRDARVLAARLEHDDGPKDDALRAAREFLAALPGLLPPPEGMAAFAATDDPAAHYAALLTAVQRLAAHCAAAPALADAIDGALAAATAPAFRVLVASDAFDEVGQDEEPEMPFDTGAFFPARKPEGEE